jgi:flagellar basal-body rod modification protein FlgD
MMITMPHPAAIKAATNDTTGTGSTGGTGNTGTTGTGSSSGTAPSPTSLGGADFLTLMLAQLKNQDPTNPVDSNTFLQQLAALSEVQGINGLQTSFATLSSSLSSGQALQASSLLGHQALVSSDSVTTSTAGTAVSGAIAVPQTSGQLLLSITNSAGVLVRQINLGAQPQGNTSFSWDGKSGDGSQAPPDTYKLSATYQGETTGSTAASTYVNGIVESVSMGGGAGSTSGLTLNVAGVGSVPFSNVQQISN